MTAQWRIVFVDGAYMDFRPPEVQGGFNFPMFVTTCRSVGMLLVDNVYVRWDMVRCVLPWQGDNPPELPRMPNAPTTETKQ